MKVYGGADRETEDGQRIAVGIADAAVATSGQLRSSGLGSCVGVALYDPGPAVAGLAHVMLPAADGDPDNPAKYADTAVDDVLARCVAAGATRDRVRAKIAGGSRMLDVAADGIGARNVRAVRAALEAADIPLVAEDVGGEHGRSLALSVADGSLEVTGPDRSVREL